MKHIVRVNLSGNLSLQDIYFFGDAKLRILIKKEQESDTGDSWD